MKNSYEGIWNDLHKNFAQNNKPKYDEWLEEFESITKLPCMYCGEYSKESEGAQYSGIDRIDSSEGYTSLNCVPCCEMCNRMKLDYDMLDWLRHIKKIADRLLSEWEDGI